MDNQRPTLTPVTIASDNADTTLAQVGDTVTVSFTTVEDIQNPPTATIAGQAATIGGANPNWTASYVMQSGDIEGSIAFTIDFDDTPGNTGTQVTATTDASDVIFDRTGPTVTDLEITIISAPTGAGSVYIIDDTITVQWDNTVATGDANTDVGGATVDFTAFGGPAAVAMANTAEIYTASYVITAGSIDASSLNVSITAIVAQVGDTVTVSFTSSENIQNPPTATIAGQAATIGGANPNWTASYVMQSGDNEGVIAFTINFTDVPGNTGTQVTAIT